MRYARAHVKRFWDFAYRRAMGISLLAFALLLAIGFIFSVSIGSSVGASYPMYLGFWIVMLVIMVFIAASNFANAHVLSARYMSKAEYKKHAPHMGAWLLVLVLGSIAFVSPLLIFGSLPLSFLLVSFGGVLLVTYLSTAMLFNVYYHEIAYGAAVLLAFFALMFFNPGNMIQPYWGATQAAQLSVPVLAIVIVTGFVGLMLLVDSSRKFIQDFEYRL